MSILGAVKVGAQVGIAVHNFVFNYTQNEYEDKIAELERLIGKLETHKKNLEDLKDWIPSFWDDENARKTVATLEITIREVNRKMDTAKDLTAVFKNTVRDLEGSKINLGNLLEDAQGLLESVAE